MDDRSEKPLTKEGPQKGQIYNRPRSNQKLDYSGLNYDGITPTDLDGLTEYKNRGYIFIEAKYRNNLLPVGQRLAIERLVIDTAKSGKKSIALVVEHYIDDPLIDVPVADCILREYFYSDKKIWLRPKNIVTTKEYVFRFLDHLKIGG